MSNDVVIIGGGPAGSAVSLFLQQAGIRSTIVEKDPFPRYHIGESMTGECGNCIASLGLRDEMIRKGHPVKWGTAVYGPSGSVPFYVPVRARSPEGNLVDASTWQVRRSQFDSMLLDTAISRGADFVNGEAIAPIVRGGAVTGVKVRTASGSVAQIDAPLVIDASGQRTFLARAGVTGPKDRGAYDNQVAIFSQVSGAVRETGRTKDDTLIFYQKKHHWAWWIPLDDDTVSVGVVVPKEYFTEKNESRRDFLARELRELNPGLSARLPEIRFTEEVRAISNYSYQVANFTGQGFLCIGDAHRFIDPVFSFGLFFAIKEAELASAAVSAWFNGANRDRPRPFAEFESVSTRGMNAIQDLIDAFWSQPIPFSVFVHSRYVDDCVDLFAGRVYPDEPSPGLLAFRKLNRRVTESTRDIARLSSLST